MKEDNVQIPTALQEYYDRIGAEVLNFRRAMVKQHSGKYYLEKCLIKIDSGGKVTVSNKDFEPTEDEQKAIIAGWVDARMPVSGLASTAEAEAFRGSISGDTFVFRSRKSDGGVIMVQQRWEKDDGTRVFTPWTFWSDGKWRPLEPDGPLPFWKPEKIVATRLMIHEGAKAGKTATAIAQSFREGKATHPWAQELAEYEHWGMIGGALAPHRSDYAEITRHNPTEVVYVCDNDWPGMSALPEVSKAYGRKLKGIQFDGRWPTGWDIADPMPASMFVRGRFNGPSLHDLMGPATWATEKFNPGGKGSPVTVIRREFAEEWYHCVQPEAFAHKDWPSKIYTLAEFNSTVRPFSGSNDTAALLKTQSASKGISLKYNPSIPSGIFVDNGFRALNTHVGTTIKAEEGDIEPFLSYIGDLLPIEDDRERLLRWIITLIARPDIKMLYGVLLISDQQGVGKSTLGEKVIAPLLGMDNVSMPGENEITEGTFNYWAAHKRLCIVHEIYAGNSSKPYNKLKSLITDDTIMINKKYQAAYPIDNWIHILACSNSMNALKLSVDDRRWFVPRVTEVKRDHAYWDRFMKWLREEGGLGIIKGWCIEQAKLGRIVMKGENAPMTEAKKEVIEEGFSPGMKFIGSMLEDIREDANGEFFYLTDIQLREAIIHGVYGGKAPDRLEKPLTIRKVAKALKFFVREEKIQARTWNGQDSKGGKVISNDPLVDLHSWAKLSEIQPLDVLQLAIDRSKAKF